MLALSACALRSRARWNLIVPLNTAASLPQSFYGLRRPHSQDATLTPCEFIPRTALCSEVNGDSIGRKVTLQGWAVFVRKLSSRMTFILLRDHSGTTQVLLNADSTKISLPTVESVISVTGIVSPRPLKDSRANGEFELQTNDVHVLNYAAALPLQVSQKIGESNTQSDVIRYTNRHLDLRKPELQRAIRARSNALQAVRKSLIGDGYIEIETPYLFKSTPEGAREYIIPVRQSIAKENLDESPKTAKVHAYALTQSPQQYKQLLMVAGFERYFQVARCFRDEDKRADRQPEFTQIDIEASFVTADDIIKVTEAAIRSICNAVALPGESLPLLNAFPENGVPVLTYESAMQFYASEKPDMRLPDSKIQICNLKYCDPGKVLKIVNLPNACFDNVKLLQYAKIITDCVAKCSLSNKRINSILGVAILKRNGNESRNFNLNHSIFHKENLPGLEYPLEIDCIAHDAWSDGDLVAFSYADASEKHSHSLGNLRNLLIDKLAELGIFKSTVPPFSATWVKNFPLFEAVLDHGADKTKYKSTHHPFTAPASCQTQQLHQNSTPSNLEGILGQSYDLVLNGCEIAGGSVRIHQRKLQERIFSILNVKASQFSHLLNALDHGCPPHAGIAIGFDRLLSILLKKESIKDVIAFPKSNGRDLMVGSPSVVADSTIEEFGLCRSHRKVGNNISKPNINLSK